MSLGIKPPTIPDGTTLQYLPGTVAHLCVDAHDPETWSCYCATSLPLKRGDEVVVFNRKTLISSQKFVVQFNGQKKTVQLLEHNSGQPV